MALTVYENKEAKHPRTKLDRRLYKTTDNRLVAEGHPDAATLYGSVGKEVPTAELEALGPVVEVPVIPPVVAEEPAPKAKPKPKPKAKAKAKPKPKAKPKAKAAPKKKGK